MSEVPLYGMRKSLGPAEGNTTYPGFDCPVCRRRDWYLLPNNEHQHRTLHIQKDVLPYAVC